MPPRGEEVRPHRDRSRVHIKGAHTAPTGQNRRFALQTGQKSGMRLARCNGLRGRARTPTCQMLSPSHCQALIRDQPLRRCTQ